MDLQCVYMLCTMCLCIYMYMYSISMCIYI